LYDLGVDHGSLSTTFLLKSAFGSVLDARFHGFSDGESPRMNASLPVARRLSAAPIVVLLLAVCLPAPSAAAPDDAVTVLPAAGTERASVYSLTGSPDNLQAERIGQRRLAAGELAPSAFTDLKILANDQQLLTDFDDRGVATTDADGTLDFSLGRSGDKPGVGTASVVGYDDEGAPVQFLYGDDDLQRIAIYDRRAESDVWENTIITPSVRAQVVQVIGLPESRIAAAIEWPSIGLSAIDIFDLSAEGSDKFVLRLASSNHDNAPQPTAQVSALRDIRDIFGLADGRLLVTTRDDLLIISLTNRQVDGRFRITDHEELAGEFIAARALPSGRVAAATVQPGLWTRPHENHKLIWFDENLEQVLARRGPLERAPWRVEPADGHGGSGTMGLRPGLNFLPSASLDDIQLAAAVELRPIPVRRAGASNASARLSNPTSRPIYLERAALLASPDGCEADTRRETLVEEVGLGIPPGGNVGLQGTFRLGEDMPTGEWCAWIQLESPDGSERPLPDSLTFEVIAPNADAGVGTGNTAEPIDLELRTADAGGFADGGRGPGQDGQLDPSGGCSCTSTPRHPPLSGLVWGLLLAAIPRARRRRSQ
jgi:MYXO-CTERM domain-containing protein